MGKHDGDPFWWARQPETDMIECMLVDGMATLEGVREHLDGDMDRARRLILGHLTTGTFTMSRDGQQITSHSHILQIVHTDLEWERDETDELVVRLHLSRAGVERFFDAEWEKA